jgi:hypothetical protein
VVEGTDDIIADSLITSATTTADVFNDANTTTINLGGSAALTANIATGDAVVAVNIGTSDTADAPINIGGDASEVTIDGNLTVNGDVTTVGATNLAVSDVLIIIADGAGTGNEAGVAFERGATGDDSLLLWNEANTRFELGLFDTTGGTSAPTGALTTLSDLRINDLSLDGTAITFDGAGTVTATGAVLSLDGTGIETSATSITADAALSVRSTGANVAAFDSDGTGDVNIGTGASAKAVTVGSTTGSSSTSIQSGTGGVSLQPAAGGDVQIDSNADATWTFFDLTVTQDETQTADSGTAGNPFSWTAGVGAAAGGTTNGGTGGAITLTSGAGGAGSGTNAGGAGADLNLSAGAGGADGGAGAGAAGVIDLNSGGTSYPVSVSPGPALTTTAQDIIGAINEIDAAAGGVTLQGAYDNDAATPVLITTDSTLDHIDITGTAALRVTATGVDNTVNAGFGFDVDTTGGFRIFGDTSSTIQVDGSAQNLTLAAAGGGTQNLVLNSAGTSASAIDVNATAGGIALDANTSISLDSVTTSNFTASGAGADLNLLQTGGGAGGVNITAAASGGVDIGATGGPVLIDASTVISLDCAANGNFTSSGASAVLTLETTGGTSRVILNSDGTGANATTVSAPNGGVIVSAGTGGIAVDTTGALSLDSTSTASNLTLTSNDAGTTTLTVSSTNAGAGAGAVDVTADGDITLDALGMTTPITLNQSGDLDLSGFTATSIIGALNEALAAATGADTLAEVLANGNTTGANNIVVSTGQSIVGADELTLVSTTTGAVSLDSGTTGSVSVGTGANSKAVTIGSNTGAATTTIRSGTGAITINSGGTLNVDAVNVLIDGTQASNFSLTGAGIDLTLSSAAGRVVVDGGEAAADAVLVDASNAAGGVTISAGTAGINIGNDAAAMTVNIGTGGTGAKTINIGDESVTGSSVTLEAGATGDITFDARGITTPITLNDAGDINLAGSFAATSIIAAFNELATDIAAISSSGLVEVYTTTGRTVGEVVIIDGDSSAATQTDADALSTSEGFIGVVLTVGASGTVVTSGTASALFVNGSATPAAGDPVYLARATGGAGIAGAGRVTGTAPTGNPNSGVVVFQVGLLKDASTLTVTTVGTDESAEINIQPMQLIVL